MYVNTNAVQSCAVKTNDVKNCEVRTNVVQRCAAKTNSVKSGMLIPMLYRAVQLKPMM